MGDGFYNAATELVDGNVARGRADKVAFIDAERSLTYGELAKASCRVANALSEKGVRRETRIAMLMLDTVDWPAVFFGAIRAGIVPVAFNTLLTTAQYRYMLEDCRAQVLFVSAELLERVEPILDELEALEHVIVVGATDGSHHSLAGLLDGASETFETAKTVADDEAFWLYSSGSTGEPKGVRHVHSSLMYTAENYAQKVLSIDEGDVMFSAAKLFFAYGLGNGLTFPMSVGATAVLFPGRPTPQAVFQVLNKHNPTLFFGVPTLYAAILADGDCTPENGSAALRLCVSAGEALPAEVSRAWKERFGVEILDGIGSTEMLHIFLSNRPDALKYGTSGTACPGYKLRLVDEAGNDVAVNEIGELLVDGGSAANGYWNKREKSRATFEGRWTRTGDKYTVDEDGFYHYCGRTDDMFKVSGIWVSPFEVEQALMSHPSVLEAAVVAQEDDKGLTKPKAFVVLKDDAAQDGLFEVLKEHVKRAAGNWKYPRWIEFVDDLPKTATGKIQRFKLRR
jgi:4-hydroxybenzoate-CoA ligase